MLPKDLSNILENYDPEDFDILITKVHNESSDLKFEIEVSVPRYNEEEEIVQNWTIETVRHRKSRISLDYASALK